MSTTRPPTEIIFFCENEAYINFGGGVSTTDVYDKATHQSNGESEKKENNPQLKRERGPYKQ